MFVIPFSCIVTSCLSSTIFFYYYFSLFFLYFYTILLTVYLYFHNPHTLVGLRLFISSSFYILVTNLLFSVCISFFFSCYIQFMENPDNQSLSVLTFTPTIDDDGKYLTCRAENPKIENSIIEDRWLLVVHCKYCISKSFNLFGC